LADFLALSAAGAAEFGWSARGGLMGHTIPDEWKRRLRGYLRQRYGEDRDNLSASDFSSRQSVIIRFPDGSQVIFRYAFAIRDDNSQEVAVFSEHCGYHVFPLGDAKLETVESVPTETE
jgi:hypothetical protein